MAKEDMLRTLYDENDRYHGSKETLFWWTANFYLLFSGGVIAWLLTQNEWHEYPWQVFAFLLAIAVLVHFFLYWQNWHKAMSAWRGEHFRELIGSLDSETLTYAAIAKLYKIQPDRKVRFFFSRGAPGFWVMLLTVVFFFAQVWVVFTKGNKEVETMTISVAQAWIFLVALIIGGAGLGLLIAFVARAIFHKDRFLREDVLDRLQRIERVIDNRPPASIKRTK